MGIIANFIFGNRDDSSVLLKIVELQFTEVVAKFNFATASVFYFKHNYLPFYEPLSDKSAIFAVIFIFPQTDSLSNTRSSVMRGHTYLRLTLRNIPRNHGVIAYPPSPRRSFGRNIQREITWRSLH